MKNILVFVFFLIFVSVLQYTEIYLFVWIFMPPLKKGAYCFTTVGRLVGQSVGLSVGRSVCRSIDQVLSAQYLLTPSLDQY